MRITAASAASTPPTVRVTAPGVAATERAQGELEDALGHTDVRAGEAAAGGRDEPALLAQVDRELADAEQLRDPLDGGLQRVRERELGGGLTDDGEQGARPLELARELLAARAGAQ